MALRLPTSQPRRMGAGMNTAARNAEIVAAVRCAVPRSDVARRYGLTPARIGQIARTHGVTVTRAPRAASPGSWSDKDIALLVSLWPTCSGAEIAAKLGRTRNSVMGKAYRLGLMQPRGRKARAS